MSTRDWLHLPAHILIYLFKLLSEILPMTNVRNIHDFLSSAQRHTFPNHYMEYRFSHKGQQILLAKANIDKYEKNETIVSWI